MPALLLLLIGILAALLWLVGRLFRAPGEKPLYADTGIEARVFEDASLRIRSKPDRIEGTRAAAAVWEFKRRAGAKSRKNHDVYPSDRAQLRASVLTVESSGIKVVRAGVKTGNGTVQEVSLGRSREALERMIAEPLRAARLVKAGGEPRALPSRAKCGGCGHRKRCPYRMA